ncbi:MAG TPA: hypothetical protein VJR58_32735, partial [Vineibacter sp.]|nr:hypothetical protein [Vineibacter sp.]
PILVAGFNSGDTDQDDLLDVGETWHYTASHTVTQDDLDTNGGGDGDIDNTATAHGTGVNDVSADASVLVEQHKALSITKSGSVPGNTADAVGETVSWTIDVGNAGNAAVANVTVTDSLAPDVAPILVAGFNSGDTDQDNLLDVGETWHYTASHTVTQDDLDTNGGGDGDIDNTATAHGTGVDDVSADASVLVEQHKALSITKSGTVPGNTADAVGETVSWTIDVGNAGNAAVANVTVTDPLAPDVAPILVAGFNSGDTDQDDLLDVGETWHYTASHTVTQDDLDTNGGGDGDIDNTATAHGTGVDDVSADASVLVEQHKALSITKSGTVPGGTADAVGETVSWTINVGNAGNAAVANVTVTDPLAPDVAPVLVAGFNSGDTDQDNLLDVTETWHYTASHTVTQADLDTNGGGDGDIDNTATAHGTGVNDVSASADVLIDRTVDLFGYKFGDLNGNGTWDKGQGEAGLANWTIELHEDTNHSGQLDAGDALVASTTTGADGSYLFDDVAVAGHTYFLNEVLQDGWKQTAPSGGTFTVHVDAGSQTFDEFDFGNQMITGPGVRTPGFWSNNGAPFWDAKADNGKHADDPCFPGGELVYQVDSNKSGGFDVNDKAGLLIGDYDKNGLTGSGEDTFFITLTDAMKVINASQKDLQDGRWVLARDAVASWLNYLAGNPIGTVDPNDGAYSPREALNDAIDWLQVTTGGNNTSTFGSWPGGGAVVKQNSASWNTGLEAEAARAGVEPGGNYIHQQLDEYNNTGSIDGKFYAFDGDNCGADQHFVQYATMLKSAEDLHLI